MESLNENTRTLFEQIYRECEGQFSLSNPHLAKKKGKRRIPLLRGAIIYPRIVKELIWVQVKGGLKMPRASLRELTWQFQDFIFKKLIKELKNNPSCPYCGK